MSLFVLSGVADCDLHVPDLRNKRASSVLEENAFSRFTAHCLPLVCTQELSSNVTALQLELPAGAAYVIEVATRVPPSALHSPAATARVLLPPSGKCSLFGALLINNL